MLTKTIDDLNVTLLDSLKAKMVDGLKALGALYKPRVAEAAIAGPVYHQPFWTDIGDPVVEQEDGWYFRNELGDKKYGPYSTEIECRSYLATYDLML